MRGKEHAVAAECYALDFLVSTPGQYASALLECHCSHFTPGSLFLEHHRMADFSRRLSASPHPSK